MIRKEIIFLMSLIVIIATGLKFVVSSDDMEDDELINLCVEKQLFIRNQSSSGNKFSCSGKMVPHPKSGEHICICPRGKGFTELSSDGYCKDCDCEEGQVTCLFDRSGYKRCYCSAGYETKASDPSLGTLPRCVRKPCLNGGTTWESVDLKNYKCTCLPGYTGRNCETELNSCEDNRCQNEGVCWRGKGNRNWCDCPPTHTGQLCETEIHVCDGNPCWNGGTCFRGKDNKYKCSCPETHTGTKCETEINPCDPNPCKNYAECCRGPGVKYFCDCVNVQGFTSTMTRTAGFPLVDICRTAKGTNS